MEKIKVSALSQAFLSGLLSTVSYTYFLDLGYGNRLRMQQLQQADWTAQQIREKELFKEQERARDSAFA